MKITKEEFVKARNNSYEAMIYCQYLIDSATTETEKNIARCLYNAHWSLYLMLNEKIQNLK